MGNIKKLKKIIRQCVANDWLDKDPFKSYKITTRETHRNFLLKDESQEIFYTESGYYPVINSFYNRPEYQKKYPEIIKFKNFMKSGVDRPANINYTKYSKIMSYYFNAAIQKKITVKQALTGCTEAIRTDKMMIKDF